MPRGRFDLAVFEGGNPDGPTIVMVHGWPDTHHMWRGVAELLADEFRLVAYDTRGQGESVTDAPDDGFTLDVLADDLLAVTDAVSPGSPVHVLGHDWGSVQAWEAVCRPGAEDRIASFTSISGPNLAHVSSWVRRTLTRPDPRGLVDLAGQAIASSYVPFLVSPFAPPVIRTLAGRQRWRLLLGAAEGRRPPPESHAATLRRDMVSGLRYYRANLGRGNRSGQQRTRVPVLQLALTRDVAVRPASLAASDPFVESLERRALPHGHWAAVTRPEVVADEVARFVDRHRART
ncbi:alpha/beta fold hydrolase [Nocardia sp. N13]|uniref:alpha/beta fold hydrolase n=1 Tax=Nocardioides sp. N13(2025) TaxID=3453405 RepID=UPI003F7692AA